MYVQKKFLFTQLTVLWLLTPKKKDNLFEKKLIQKKLPIWISFFNFLLGERHYSAVPSISTRKNAPTRISGLVANLRRFNVRILQINISYNLIRWA